MNIRPLALLTPLLLAACTTLPAPTSTTIPTPIAIAQLTQHAAAADHALAQAQPVIEHLSAQTLTDDKPAVRLYVAQARGELTSVTTAAPAVIAQSQHDEKTITTLQSENQKLRTADPARTWLTRLGILLTAAGLAMLALALFEFKNLLDWSLITLITGAAMVTLARFLAQIELAIALTAALALIALATRYAIKYRTDLEKLIAATRVPTP
jgi:hypothetical protein